MTMSNRTFGVEIEFLGNRTKVLEDTPSVRGMVNKVAHLLKVEQA